MRELVSRNVIRIQDPAVRSGGFRAVFLSDMHNRIWSGGIERMVSLIEAEKPDVVLCGGDMIEAHPGCGKKNVDIAAAFIRRLAGESPVYYAFGNHEYRAKIYPEVYGDMYEKYIAALRDANVVFLDNESERTEINGMPAAIFGLSISRRYYKRFKKTPLPVSFVNKALGQPDAGRVNILLAHHPKYLGTYFKWGADITLCGHYHGGVMRLSGNKGLISPDPSVFPHAAHGILQRDGKAAVISAGMGEHTIPFRVNNPREIMVLDIEVW